jgi:AcrR family transcriptional regulator
VAAPSVARHFPDRTAIIDAVVAEQLAGLHNQLLAAADADPVARLYALCHAYTSYARAHPARYRILVGRRFVEDWNTQDRVMDQTAPLMAAAIGLVSDTIQACIDTGASDSTDAHLDTTILWFALHGLVTVPQAITSLTWPDFDYLLAACITKAVGLHTSPTATAHTTSR